MRISDWSSDVCSSDLYQLANGRMAKLFDDSALVGEPWLVASELRFEARDALLLRAAPVDERFLRSAFAERFSDSDETRWDAERRALVAERRSEEHTSELQSLMRNSYAVFCLKKKNKK